MINSNKLIYHPLSIINKTPITADIFLTEYCNNNCVYCRYDKSQKYTSFENFKSYADRLLELGVKGFVLTGGGEPTLNPDFEKIISWLDDNSLEYGLNTNFNIYKEIRGKYLKISLDRWDKTSYNRLRNVDSYETVIENIKKYLKFKQLNDIGTKVVIQCIPSTANDVMQFYEAHKQLNVNNIVYRPIESVYSSYYKNTPTSILTAIEDLKNIDDRVVLSFKWNELKSYFEDCYANWSQIALNCDGDVMICCHRPKDIVGSIFDENILEKKNNFNIDTHKCDVPCRLTGANHFMVEYNKNILDKDFI